MSFLANKARTNPRLPLHRTLLDVPDGGVVVVDWLLQTTADLPEDTLEKVSDVSSLRPALQASKGVALVLHGLSGSSRSPYISHMLRVLHSAGWTCAVMEARGCGETPLRNVHMFSAGFTEDVRRTADVVRGVMGPEQPLIAIGYSLGGNILTKYLGEEGPATPITAAIAISNPLDLVQTDLNMRRPLQRWVYSPIMVAGLQQYYSRNEAALRSTGVGPPLEDVQRCRTVTEFDTKVVVPLFGYRDVQHYYTDASSCRLLDKVAVPLLLLDAMDDAVTGCSYRGARAAAAAADNPNVFFAQTRAGGHVGFLQFPPLAFWAAPSWADRVVVQFAEAAALVLRGPPAPHDP